MLFTKGSLRGGKDLPMQRKIAVLRYELEHPATVSPDEMIEALSFARRDSEGRGSGHISNKTLYIAMNYQTEAAQMSGQAMDEVVRQLIPLEREVNRLTHHVSLLSQRQGKIIRLYCATTSVSIRPFACVQFMRITVKPEPILIAEAFKRLWPMCAKGKSTASW